MATTTTKAVSVDDFAEFVEHLASRPSMQQEIKVFLAKLAPLKSEGDIRDLSEQKLSDLRARWKNKNTLKAKVRDYRGAVRRWQTSITLDESNSRSAPDDEFRDPAQNRTHYALAYLRLPEGEYREINEKQKRKTDSQRQSLEAFNPFRLIEIAEVALDSQDLFDKAAAFEFLTGRRPTEVLKGEGFEATGLYTMAFSGQLKRAEGDQGTYTIYTLCESHKLIAALDQMDRQHDLRRVDGLTNMQIDNDFNTRMNRAVRRIFGEHLNPPGEKRLSNKNLRAAYPQAAAVLFKPPEQSLSFFAEKLLGHKGVSATVSYEDYVCVDDSGKEMTYGQWCDRLDQPAQTPLTRGKTTLNVDPWQSDRVAKLRKELGLATRPTVDILLNTYDQHQALLRRLEKLEQENVQLQEEAKRLKQDGPSQVAEEKPPSTSKWVGVSKDELLATRSEEATDEKIRRCIAAIKRWNEDKPNEEMYRISAANLKAMSGTRHERLKKYLSDHPELEKYNQDRNMNSQHDRGKTPIAEVITDW